MAVNFTGLSKEHTHPCLVLCRPIKPQFLLHSYPILCSGFLDFSLPVGHLWHCQQEISMFCVPDSTP